MEEEKEFYYRQVASLLKGFADRIIEDAENDEHLNSKERFRMFNQANALQFASDFVEEYIWNRKKEKSK